MAAGLDSVTPTEQTEDTVQTTARPVVTPMASKGRFATATPSGPIAMAPGILENMQRVLEEKEARKNSFAEGIKDVSAWFPGYQGNISQSLATRAKTREDEIGDIFQMRNQIAQMKAAQDKQANFEARRANQLGMGSGTGQQGAQSGGMYMPDHIKVALANAPTQEAYDKIFNEFAVKYNTNSTMFTPTVPVVAIGPDGQPYRKTVSVDEYRRNQHLYEDTPQTQKAVTTATGGASTPSAAPAAAPTSGAQPPVSVRNNNPGNLVDSKTGKIRTFDTPEEGEAALDADVEGKLSGKSEAYKQRFGEQPITPARLAETWAPAKAPGNSAESTTNYGGVIAKELGIGPNDPIPNTPEAIEAVKRAITRFEAGTPAKAPVTSAAPVTTAAPVATPTAAPTRRPTPGALEREEEVTQTFRKGLAEADAADIKKQQEIFSQQTEAKSVAERITSSERVINVVKKHPNAVGMLTSPGIMNALATIARDGLNTPSGAIGIKTIEDALTVAMPGSSKAVIEARREIAQNLARNALEASKLSQGQGTVSDFERTMFEKIAGSLSDTPEMLVKRQEMLLHRARLDKELGVMFRQSGTPGKPKDYAAFIARPDVQAKIDKYEEQLRTTLASEIKLSGKKAESKVPSFQDADKERRYQEWKSQQNKAK
jgi:hypothetical protein